MKKVTAILLSILMLVSVFVSCVGDDNTTTTDIPTTEAPTTEAPTTEAPTTEAPTTEAPTTEAPTTEAPTTELPTTETPTTETPTTQPAVEYNITYELNGGTNSSENPATYKEGEGVILFVPEKEGYAFGGWYTDSEFSNAITQIKDMAKDVTLYAKWTTGYKINYVLNGGVNSVNNPHSYNTGEHVNLLAPKKEGYEFGGWYTEPEFENRTELIRSDSEGDVTVYAKWYDLSNGLILELDGDSYTVIGCDSDAITVTIPKSYNGLPVTKIDDAAFFHCVELESVEIPDSVVYIGRSVFSYCGALKKLTIPDSVTSPLQSIFFGCGSLTEVNIGAGITEINDAFKESINLAKITVSNNNSKFVSAGGILYSKDAKELVYFPPALYLPSYSIPEGVTTVNSGAFYYPKHLETIKIPKSLTTFDISALANCLTVKSYEVDSDNPNYKSVGGVLFNKNGTTLIHYPIANNSTTYTIPSGVTKINSEAFSGNEYLTKVIIPDSVSEIGGAAFSGCTSLASIEIPEGVTKLEGSTFNECSNLTSVRLPSTITSFGYGEFSRCAKLEYITLPDGLTEMGDYAFYRSGLRGVNIPKSLTEIGYSAFENCESLRSIVIHGGIKSIGNRAFYYCRNFAK